jgi:glutamate-1-semialdehyde 2,1-aminomutase
MLGGGGGFPATAEFLALLREETRAQGALLIVDEVMTSRLAPGGLHRELGVDPDLMTVGKYLGGGMSFGAIGGREEIMARFDPRRPDAWGHAGTFNNNVATMAGGHAALTQVLTPEALAALNARGDRLREMMNAAARDLDVPAVATGRGSILAYHFAPGPVSAPHEVPATPPGLRTLMHLGLIERGFHSARRGFLSLSLPLSDADVDAFAAAFREVLSRNAPLIREAVAEAA